jgi:hypothetical protein
MRFQICEITFSLEPQFPFRFVVAFLPPPDRFGCGCRERLRRIAGAPGPWPGAAAHHRPCPPAHQPQDP